MITGRLRKIDQIYLLPAPVHRNDIRLKLWSLIKSEYRLAIASLLLSYHYYCGRSSFVVYLRGFFSSNFLPVSNTGN